MRMIFAALAAASLAAPAAADPISALVVFGDSNVDIGRAAAEFASNTADGRVPPPGTVAGRASDGPLLPEFVAERLRVPQLNFAWSGATAGETNAVGVMSGAADMLRTGALAQIAEFEAGLDGRQADAEALYLVFAGSNDLVRADKDDQGAVDVAVEAARTHLATAVRRLTVLGAERIVLATRTPRPVLSDAPRPAEEPDPAARNDAAGRQLNAAIRDLVAELDAALDARVRLFDDYAVIRAVIAASPGPGGFEPYSSDPSQFCVRRGDCGGLVNYDGAHKTSAVHARLAEHFVEQLDLTPAAPAPVPATAWALLLGATALVSLRRLRRRGAARP